MEISGREAGGVSRHAARMLSSTLVDVDVLVSMAYRGSPTLHLWSVRRAIVPQASNAT